MRTLLLCSALLLAAIPAMAADQATPPPAASAHAEAALTQALDAVCKPWLAGAERKQLASQLKTAGWENFVDTIFTAKGSWGEVSAKAYSPAEGRECDASFWVNETPWSTAKSREAADRWATANIGGAKQDAELTVQGQPVHAWAWVRNDGVIVRLSEWKTKQTPESQGDLLFMVSPPKPPVPAPPPAPGTGK